MAQIHQASVTPSKLELLAAWLPTRVWYRGRPPRDLRRVAACRFDDPAGRVGVETFLVRAADGPLLHAPMTYRDAPLPGGDPWLIGVAEHSVLGTRWVYDATGDPVYVAALIEAVRTGGREAGEYVETPDGPVAREPLMAVRGSGTSDPAPAAVLRQVTDGDPTRVRTDRGELAIRRVLDETPADEGLTLTGTWAGQPTPTVLAVLR